MIEIQERQPAGTAKPIEVLDLNAAYGVKKILEDITFSVEKGEFLGLIGPNGSGKTTLLKVLSKIITPEAGTVYLDGRDLEEITFRELAQNLAVVPQEVAIGFDYTVREIVMMGRHPYISRLRAEDADDLRLCNQAMELTRVETLANASINEISGGERQRVLIARALAQEPRILLLDEATSNLDISHRIEILNIIRGLTDKITVISVFHDLNLAAYYCDRLIVLKDRRIYAIGPPEDVLTAETIRAVFGIDTLIRHHPFTRKPYVLPVYERPAAPEHEHARRIHVICGGGTGSDLLYLLSARGFVVTCGVLNVLDTDYGTALHLGLPSVAEPPFHGITPESLAELRGYLDEADAIIVMPMPIGQGNIENIRVLLDYAEKTILVVGEPGSDAMEDFTGGDARALLDEVEARGATRVRGPEDLAARLALL